jgi:hypothetical protein
MGRNRGTDRVESALRRADATLEAWFRRGAGVVRQQVNRLQGRLKQVSTGLEQLEKDPKPAAKTRRNRPASTRRASTRPRKTKKAA